MSGDPRVLEAQFAQVVSARHDDLRHWLERAFVRLKNQADDILQEAYRETLRRIRDEAFCPEAGWVPWLRTVARSRAVDRLRSVERRLFRQLSGVGRQAVDSSSSSSEVGELRQEQPGPDTQLAEAERRGRQGLLLSQVLEQFCRWCEKRSERAQIREAYERSLRGQQAAVIAAAMGIPADEVYGLLNRARQWVFQRIRQADVDRSVFLTLHRRKRD